MGHPSGVAAPVADHIGVGECEPSAHAAREGRTVTTQQFEDLGLMPHEFALELLIQSAFRSTKAKRRSFGGEEDAPTLSFAENFVRGQSKPSSVSVVADFLSGPTKRSPVVDPLSVEGAQFTFSPWSKWDNWDIPLFMRGSVASEVGQVAAAVPL